MLYVRDTFRFTMLATSNTLTPGKPRIIEYIMGFVNIGEDEPIFICLAYRPLDVSLINDPYFADQLKLYAGDYSTKIVMGDFNANLLKVSTDATFLRDLTSELALKVIEHGSTNFTTVPGTWIDAIFVDSNDIIIDTENRPAPYHNSHNLISVTLNRTTSSAPCESFTYRVFNEINPEEVNSLLRNYDWSPFDNVSPDLTDMLTKLTKNLNLAVDSLTPLRTVIPKKRQPPWINSELHTLYSKRDAALRRYKRTRDRTALEEFLRLRALSTDSTKQVRTNYIHNSLEKTLSNNGNFWKKLRSLGLLPRSRRVAWFFLK